VCARTEKAFGWMIFFLLVLFSAFCSLNFLSQNPNRKFESSGKSQRGNEKKTPVRGKKKLLVIGNQQNGNLMNQKNKTVHQ
jgi:hypothetical protein